MNKIQRDCGTCRRKGFGSKCFTPEGEKCMFWLPMLCPYCGGALSELRDHNGRKHRHCYSCHFEFYEEE